MKFAHELLALQADCPAEFSGRFINYKQLKKLIKQIRDVEAAGGPDSPAEAQFLHLLNVEVAAVNRTFETHAQDLVQAAAVKRRRRKSCCLPRLRKQTMKEDDLAQHALWCRRFAAVNATGLRKIAKKHDKYAQNDAGKQFVQACWDCRNKDLGAFLHSPLIDELRALERLSDAHRTSRAALERATPVQASRFPPLERLSEAGHDEEASAATGRAASPKTSMSVESAWAAHTAALPEGDAMQMEAAPPQALHAPQAAAALSEDTTPGDSPRSGDSAESTSFRCAICLAPMWMPVGLSCGHIFCAECVFQAVGVRAWTRPLDEVLADVPPTAKCPKCRQRYVFREVLELHEFGAVIRFKYPEAVSHRAAAAAAALCHLQEELQAGQQGQGGPGPVACEQDTSITAPLAPVTGSPTRWGSGRRTQRRPWSSSAWSRSAKLRSAAAAACLSSWSRSRGDSDWWDVDRAIQWGVC